MRFSILTWPSAFYNGRVCAAGLRAFGHTGKFAKLMYNRRKEEIRMNRLKEKLRTFMIGRYGADQLGRDFSWLVLALCLAKLIVHRGFGAMVLDTFILAGLAVLYFRICSREIGKRSMENQAYLRYRFRAEEWFKRMKFRFQEGRRYHIYKCPGCGQKVRIPRGHGKVSIHCPKCGRDFIKRS